MSNYYIIRHGQTKANLNGILQGHLNVPLSEYGKNQAEITGKALSTMKIDAIYSSDLIRAKDTAMAIAKYHNCKLILDKRLREAYCGIMQGKTISQCRELYKEYYKAVAHDPINTSRPGGGESNKDMYERAVRALYHIQNNCSGTNIVIVSHGGIIRCLLSHAKKGRFDPELSGVRNASISIISNHNGNWHLGKTNDISHLASIAKAK